MELSNEVISLLDKASQIDRDYRDPYVWRSMAYNQRMFARAYIDPPVEPEDKLEAILAREDSMLAWRETQAVCDIDSIPACAAEIPMAELFQDAGKFAEAEVILVGRTVGASVAGEGMKFTLQVEVDLAAPVAPAVAPPEGAPPTEAPASEGPKKVVTVDYTFMAPKSPEGEDLDPVEYVAGVTGEWKEGKKISFAGRINASGDRFTVVEHPVMGCCPAAPLSAVAVAEDQQRKLELEQAIAEKLQAELNKKGKKRKGKGR
jgi:hypothetical protein